jgi:hypothetical protein
MKHLRAFKLFESIESLWEPITGDDWAQRMSTWVKDLPIDEKDKNVIREFVNRFYDGEPNYDFSLHSTGRKVEIEISNDKGYGDSKLLLLVAKTEDEWFLVKEYFYKWHKGGKTSSWRQVDYLDTNGNKVYESYYKCDTIDGLIELLKARIEWVNR